MRPTDPLNLALKAVIEASGASGRLGAFARQLRPLLEAAAGGAAERRPAVRDVGEIEYLVQSAGDGETLVERRLSGRSKPFRCPKAVYDAIVAVLVASEQPKSIDDLLGAVERTVGFRPAEFQVRVALRFWLYRQPPLIVRNRSRYAAAANDRFAASAHDLWKKISK